MVTRKTILHYNRIKEFITLTQSILKHFEGQIYLLSVALLLLSSCKKLVDVEPPITRTTSDGVFKSDVLATALMTGVYASVSSTSVGAPGNGLNSIVRRTGLSGDELKLWSGAIENDQAYFKNALIATDQNSSAVNASAGHELWTSLYPLVITCNSVIEGCNSSTQTLNPTVKNQLLGEAKFMRAFVFFYLTNLYGDIPLTLTSDFEVNRLLKRSSVNAVYEQIISDLKDAESLLSTNFLDATLLKSTPDRVRPTAWAAKALLARVYLYKEDWVNAEIQATALINQTAIFDTVSLNNVFIKNSKESIWQLQPVNVSGAAFYNTEESRFFVLTAAPTGFNSTHTTFLSPQLSAAFEANDKRKTNWVGLYTDGTGSYQFSNKYKVAIASSSITEYTTVLRLGEQYLIRAEARAQLNKIVEAQADLNVIRKRAGLSNNVTTDKAVLVSDILKERQVELFTEWGHRWLDLKRSNTINTVMDLVTPLKSNGAPWQPYQKLYPIPFTDVLRNPQLVQNPGY